LNLAKALAPPPNGGGTLKINQPPPMFFLTLTLLIAPLCLSCSVGEYKTLAESEVPKFHDSLDAGKFEDLYGQSSDDFKKAASKEDFVKLITAVHNKLGNVFGSKSTYFNVNFHTGGTFVTLAYETSFVSGKGAEKFVYRIKNNKPFLNGYWINSNDLIIK
jgi:hypothetical protein